MSTPLFSVVCPAYNALRTIGATLRSVLAQSCADFEVVVVDDGSSDETPDLVQRFADEDGRIRLVRQANAGTAGARNRGIAEARGRFVSIIDNDDLWLPGYLEAVAAALESAPEAGLCFCDIWMIDDRTRRVFRNAFEVERTEDPVVIPAGRLSVELLRDNFIPASATTLTRAALDATGGFDASVELKGSDDLDLWLRVADAGFDAVKAPGILAVWRDRTDSESKDRLMMWRSANAAARRSLARNPAGADVQAAANELLAVTEREIAILTDASPSLRARAALRARLGAVKRRATRSRDWREPPAELARFLDEVDPPAQPG